MNYYTNEKNTLILISLLKKYNIKKIITSPGATNISFVSSCQYDGFFEMYSAVDERTAAFMACGMAMESKEVVVLTCTGATASRNYIPGLTKAYYANLPIIAVTSTLNVGKIGYYVPQLIDRTRQFNDLVVDSYQLNSIYSKEDENIAVTNINYLLHNLCDNNCGPLHINLATNYSFNFSIKKLPDYKKILFFDSKSSLPKISNGKIGIFIGNHKPFSEEEIRAIDNFCSTYNAIVLCDKTSNYHGEFEFQASLSNVQEKVLSSRCFDLIIHIGYVSGSYINLTANEIWRVNPDGKFRNVFGRLSAVFMMEEIDFFRKYFIDENRKNSLIKQCNIERTFLLKKIKNLPFSNIAIAKELSAILPEKSVLHLGILNSLRAWNFFDLNKNIEVYSNTGGFGIDGCLSSAIGAATVNVQKEYFIVLGDLAFFYDVNILYQKSPKNLHILIVNNGLGCEFKNYNHRAAIFGEQANDFIAAKGHNGKKSTEVIKSLAIANNFE